MSVFKVGQRVRKVARNSEQQTNVVPGWPLPQIGAEGTIVRVGSDGGYSVTYDKYPTHPDYDCWRAEAGTLAPLTDPRCSDFIADMERFSSLNKVKA